MSTICLISTWVRAAPHRLAAGSALFGFCLTLFSCAADSSDAAGIVTGSGGSGGSSSEAPTLRFVVDHPSEIQTLFPEEIREFQVEATPPDIYRVRFSLVPVEGMPPHDASLDRTDAQTDQSGLVSVTVRAPSVVTQFTLQAAIGSMSATSLTIDVQTQGEAELQVVPEYNGQRPIREWVANAYMNITCSELSQKQPIDRGLPSDSTLFSATSVYGIPPRLTVSVAPYMAVTARAGHYAFGCANFDQPLINELNTVRVPVANQPILLAGVDVDLTLGIDETTNDWIERLETAASEVLAAFTAGTENDLVLLLDTMRDRLDDAGEREAFQNARESQAWEIEILPSLSSMDGLLLRNELSVWIESGLEALSSERAFVGRVMAPKTADEGARLSLLEVGGADAERAGFVPIVDATWTADPNDTIALGATLRWSPAALVTGLAESQAALTYSDIDSLSQALAQLISCEALGDVLVSDVESNVVFSDCDATCMSELCESALIELADRARGASETQHQLQLSAAGAALVDDEARLVSFEGSWRGTFPDGESFAVGGAALGSESEGDD